MKLHILPIALSFLPSVVQAALNGRCAHGSDAEFNNFGICVKTSTCAHYNGRTKNNLCPDDPDDVKCCVVEMCGDCGERGCSYCQWTSDGCEFHWENGTFAMLYVVVAGMELTVIKICAPEAATSSAAVFENLWRTDQCRTGHGDCV